MKENIIVQIIRIFGALITTLLGIFIPKSFDNKKRAVVDKNCAIKEDEPCILLSSFSSILEQNINKIDDEYSKIFIKFSITLIAINQKNKKADYTTLLQNFVILEITLILKMDYYQQGIIFL